MPCPWVKGSLPTSFCLQMCPWTISALAGEWAGWWEQQVVETAMLHQFFWISVANERLVERKDCNYWLKWSWGIFCGLQWFICPLPAAMWIGSTDIWPGPPAQEGGSFRAWRQNWVLSQLILCFLSPLECARLAARTFVTRRRDSVYFLSPSLSDSWRRSYVCVLFTMYPHHPAKVLAYSRYSVDVQGMNELSEHVRSRMSTAAYKAPSDWLGGKMWARDLRWLAGVSRRGDRWANCMNCCPLYTFCISHKYNAYGAPPGFVCNDCYSQLSLSSIHSAPATLAS